MIQLAAFHSGRTRLFGLALVALTLSCEDCDEDLAEIQDLDFGVIATVGYNHTMPGVESVECKLIETDPPQSGADWSMTVRGPLEDPAGPSGVIAGQEFGGNLDAAGKARVNVRIRRFGTYENVITVFRKDGVPIRRTVNSTVAAAASSCP